MKIFLILICLLFISGCTIEYVYENYKQPYNDCTYTDMHYIKDYINHKDEYVDYDTYMKINYQNSNPYINASNARRAFDYP